MNKIKIFLDAGHNNSKWNTGASGFGLREQDITFDVANGVAQALRNLGVEVMESRPTKETNLGTDNTSAVNARWQMANTWGADYFISIHCNAGGGTGAETLYRNSKDFAQTVQYAYVRKMGLRDRGIKYRDNIAVLNHTTMPSCLLELAFMDTESDSDVLRHRTKDMIDAVIAGLQEFLNIEETQSNDHKISESNIKAMAELGVMQSPEYWRNQSIKWLNELLSSAAKDGVLDSRIDNGISDINIALEVLVDAGIIGSLNYPDYWRSLIRDSDVKYLGNLLINIANKCLIVLLKIVHAESRGEDEKGQILVANVINNRHNSKSFPNGIHNIVFQENQFQPTRNGSYAKAIPSESVKRAINQALSGVDHSQGALFFRSVNGLEGSWHRTKLEHLFTYQGHAFFK